MSSFHIPREVGWLTLGLACLAFAGCTPSRLCRDARTAVAEARAWLAEVEATRPDPRMAQLPPVPRVPRGVIILRWEAPVAADQGTSAPFWEEEEEEDVDARDRKGRTSLHHAARDGHERWAESLLRADADEDARDDRGRTPLYYAARAGHRDVAKVLLKHHADLNAKDEKGRKAWQVARDYGHDDLAEYLKKKRRK